MHYYESDSEKKAFPAHALHVGDVSDEETLDDMFVKIVHEPIRYIVCKDLATDHHSELSNVTSQAQTQCDILNAFSKKT